jgi:hypothetical protein
VDILCLFLFLPLGMVVFDFELEKILIVSEAYFFTLACRLFAGLKAGMWWAGMVRVVFLEMLRATFSARFLMMKLPKPLK